MLLDNSFPGDTSFDREKIRVGGEESICGNGTRLFRLSHFLLLAFNFPFKDRDVQVGVTIRVLVGISISLFNGCLVFGDGVGVGFLRFSMGLFGRLVVFEVPKTFACVDVV